MTAVFHRELSLNQLLVVQALADKTGWSVYDCPRSTSWLSLIEVPDAVMVVLSASSPSILSDIASIRRVEPSTSIFVWLSNHETQTGMQLIQAGVSGLIPLGASHEMIERTLQLRTKLPTSSRQSLCAVGARSKALASSLDFLALAEGDVLISGPSGSGKEVCASLIHQLSRRSKRPISVLNCPALPLDLAEAELFGFVKGAFTGAVRDQAGLIREAEGGTLLLDEVSALPLSLQAKMLRVIQEREIRPVGSRTTVPIDVRILSTSNQDLPACVAAGQFREDLLYRLAANTLRVPSLLERRTDIAALSTKFIQEYCGEVSSRTVVFGKGCLSVLVSATWPGNVRQLRSFVRGAAALAENGQIEREQLEQLMEGEQRDPISKLFDLTYAFAKPLEDYLRTALRQCNYDYAAAASMVDLHLSSLYRLIPPAKTSDPAPFRRGSKTHGK